MGRRLFIKGSAIRDPCARRYYYVWGELEQKDDSYLQKVIDKNKPKNLFERIGNLLVIISSDVPERSYVRCNVASMILKERKN